MLSQRRAAQAWGISRATLQRAVSGGKLSVLPDGTIDPAEMLRAFGEAKGGPVGNHNGPLGPPLGRVDEMAFQAEIRVLKAQIEAKEALLSAKERHIEDLSQALRLLAGPPAPAPQPSLMARLFFRQKPPRS